MPESTPIDVSWLRKTFDDDTVLAELYAMYETDTAKRIGELRGAFDAQDAARCSRVAHAMKGSSANIGAGRMSNLAGRLEKHDWSTDPNGAGALVAAIEAEFSLVQAFIRHFLAATPVAG